MNHKTMRKETLALGIVALLSGSLAVAGASRRYRLGTIRIASPRSAPENP